MTDNIFQQIREVERFIRDLSSFLGAPITPTAADELLPYAWQVSGQGIYPSATLVYNPAQKTLTIHEKEQEVVRKLQNFKADAYSMSVFLMGCHVQGKFQMLNKYTESDNTD